MKPGNRYLLLVRREFWEHRGLWLAPVIAAGLLLIAAIFGALNISHGVHFTPDPAVPPDAARLIGAVSLLGLAASIGLFAGIVTVIYLQDCLFAERRDRSILFWKSLPVSDAETVLTKFIVALLLVPLIVLVLAVVLQVLLAGIGALRVPDIRAHVLTMLGGGLAAVPRLVGIGIYSVLWYAPVAAYLMLASVIAKRAPMLYAVLPPVALVVAEELLFSSNHVFRFVIGRLALWTGSTSPFVTRTEGSWAAVNINWAGLFSNPALWLGAMAAAAMVYAVIRLRRYRDDT